MTKAMFGKHSAVIVPRQDRDNIRKFHCDVLATQCAARARRRVGRMMSRDRIPRSASDYRSQNY
jgi:hypothetical protein